MRTKSERIYDEATELGRRLAKLTLDLEAWDFFDRADGDTVGEAIENAAEEARWLLLSGRKDEIIAFLRDYNDEGGLIEGWGKPTSKEFYSVMRALERFRWPEKERQ
jgi:hypothetical protein